jgi:hypothetical protein
MECLAIKSNRGNTFSCSAWLPVSAIKGETRSEGVQYIGIYLGKHQA